MLCVCVYICIYIMYMLDNLLPPRGSLAFATVCAPIEDIVLLLLLLFSFIM